MPHPFVKLLRTATPVMPLASGIFAASYDQYVFPIAATSNPIPALPPARYPTDFVHGLLSSHSYNDSHSGDTPSLGAEHKYNAYLSEWRVVEPFEDKASGFRAVLYENKAQKQAVLAFRGTTVEWADLLKPDSPLATDMNGVLGGRIVPQQRDAYEATHKAILHAKAHGEKLSLTGHSLGGWLAQQGGWFCRCDFDRPDVKVITFDSPGTARTFDAFKSNVQNPRTKLLNDPTNLHITNYLSAPNFVNSCNGQVGDNYALTVTPPLISLAREKVANLNIPKPVKEFIQAKQFYLFAVLSLGGHGIDLILEQFDPVTGKPRTDCVHTAPRWPVIKYNGTSVEQSFLSKLTAVDGFSKNTQLLAGYLSDMATIGCVLQEFQQLLRGNIDPGQYFRTHEILGDGANHKIAASDPTQFSLHYEGHYKLVPYNPYVDNFGTDTHPLDNLLKILEEITIDGAVADPSGIRSRLIKLKDTYSIESTDSGIIISANSEANTIEQIRDEMIDIKACYSTSFPQTIFDKYLRSIDDHNVLATDPVGRSNGDIPPMEFKFVDRENVRALLKKYSKIIVQGEGGVGKTSLAMEYAYEAKKDGAEVRWIDAGSRNEVIRALDGVKLTNRAEKATKLVLIFDNVTDISYVEKYLQNLGQNIEVIITTRNSGLGRVLGPVFHIIEPEPFTEQEARAYLTKNRDENRLSETVIKKMLLKTKIEDGKWLPYDVNQVLETIAPRNAPLRTEATMLQMLDDYKRESPESFAKLTIEDLTLLKYCTALDMKYIDARIVSKLLNKTTEALHEQYSRLAEHGLIKIIYKSGGKPGFYMHDRVKDQLDSFLATPDGQARKIVFSPKQLVEVVADRWWQSRGEKGSGDCFYSQAGKMMEIAKSAGASKAAQIMLCNGLTQYYSTINSNITMQYLKVWEAIITPIESFPSEIQHNNIGVCYHNLKDYTKALLFYSKALSKASSSTLNDIWIWNAANAYKVIGDNFKAQALYKVAYVKRKARLGEDHDETKLIQAQIEDFESFKQSLAQGHKWGMAYTELSPQEIEIKIKLQPTLSKISELAKDDLWSYACWNIPLLSSICPLGDGGMRYYASSKNHIKAELTRQLGHECSDQELKIAQALVIEAVNLGVAAKNPEPAALSECQRKVVSGYPEAFGLVKTTHQDYFADESIRVLYEREGAALAGETSEALA